METKPTQKTLVDVVGISQTMASFILRGERNPSRPLAIRILRATGWRHDVLTGLSDADISTLERIEPWTPSRAPESAAA